MRYSTLKVALYVTLVAPISMSLPSVTDAESFGGRGASGFSSGRGISSPGVSGGRFGQGASIIGDGMGGFKMYSPSGTSRYLGNTPSSGKVYHPDGSSSVVIPDGRGNLNIYGPQGTHKSYGNPTHEVNPTK